MSNQDPRLQTAPILLEEPALTLFPASGNNKGFVPIEKYNELLDEAWHMSAIAEAADRRAQAMEEYLLILQYLLQR